ILEAFRAVDWGGAISEVLDLIVSGISAGAGAMGNLWGWLTDSLQSAFSSMRTALGNAIQLAWNSITSLNWGDWINPLNWATWIGGKIADFGSWLWEKIKGGFDAATDFIAGPIADFGTFVWDKIKTHFPAAAVLAGAIADFAQMVWDKISSHFP